MNIYETYQRQRFMDELSNNILPGITVGLIIGAIVIFAILFIGVFKSKHKDDNKPINIQTVKVLEKLPPKKSSWIVEDWFVLETSNGNRFQLRNINTKNIYLTIGDYGEVSFKGQTIISFNHKHI